MHTQRSSKPSKTMSKRPTPKKTPTLLLTLLVSLTALLPSVANAEGYHYVRKSTNGFVGANGFLTLPNAYASSTITQTYPEFFFSLFATASGEGIDIGLQQTNGGWQCISWAATIVDPQRWRTGCFISNLSPGATIQVQALLYNKAGTGYVVQLDVYDNSGVILGSHVVPVTSTWANSMLQSGFIDRELSLATNQGYPTYLTNGSYFYSAQWGKTWLIDKNGAWYAWSNARTASSGMKVDGGYTPLTSKYSASATETAGYAYETASIYYK